MSLLVRRNLMTFHNVLPPDANLIYIKIEGTKNCEVKQANSQIKNARISEKVFINDGLYTCTKIRHAGFSNRMHLTNVIIPNSVIFIDYNAFHNCDQLAKIILPDSITQIGQSAFQNCDILESITLSKSLTQIGQWVFDACPMLSNVIFNGTIDEWNAVEKLPGWDGTGGTIGHIPATVVHCTDGDAPI